MPDEAEASLVPENESLEQEWMYTYNTQRVQLQMNDNFSWWNNHLTRLKDFVQQGTGDRTKTDEFSEKFKRGGRVILKPKIYITDFGPLYGALNRDFRKRLQGVKGRLEYFRKFICFGAVTRPS